MAQKLGETNKKSPSKQLNLAKQKLSTDKRLISPERQERLDTSLLRAAPKGKTKIAERLLALGANIEAKTNNGETALHLAANYGCTETIRFLISKGFDVNAKDNNGWTPLMHAVVNNHRDACVVLIQKGTNIKTRCDSGFTALMLAESYYTAPEDESEKDEIIEFLKLMELVSSVVEDKAFIPFMVSFANCIQ
jgi:ankyrin repeat protein